MNYQVIQLLSDPPQYRITGPNCQFDFGSDRSTTASHVCGELNRLVDANTVLAGERNRLAEHGSNVDRKVAELQREVEVRSQALVNFERDLRVQIDAKCKAIKERDDLKTLCEELGQKLADKTRMLQYDKKLVQTLVAAIRESQQILGVYLEPTARGPKAQAAFVDSVLEQLIGILDNRDLVMLVNEIPFPNSGQPEKAAETYVESLRPTVLTDTLFVDGVEYRRVHPLTEDSVTFGAGSSLEVGNAIHETLERVINNTTNYFGQSKKLKRKNRKLKGTVKTLRGEIQHLREKIDDLEKRT